MLNATNFILANADASLIGYFNDSNFMGKVIVIVLLICSVIAWAVMIGKHIDLKELTRLNLNVDDKLGKSKSVIEAVVSHGKSLRGPYANLLKDAVGAWGKNEGTERTPELITLRMGLVENALQRAVSRQIIFYESKMVLLGTIITGAPFMGLLGTAWGVMDAFGAMSSQTTATLQMLAPGVSGALLTTVAALVVAIPSTFGYNFLLTKSRSMVTELENFASSLADRIELESRVKSIVVAPSKAETNIPVVNAVKTPLANPAKSPLAIDDTVQETPASEPVNFQTPTKEKNILNFDDDDDSVSIRRYED